MHYTNLLVLFLAADGPPAEPGEAADAAKPAASDKTTQGSAEPDRAAVTVDAKTTLQWSRPNTELQTYSQAESFCRNLKAFLPKQEQFPGGWRLPAAQELETAQHLGGDPSATVATNIWWTSTEDLRDKRRHIVVKFSNYGKPSSQTPLDDQLQAKVRCVRGTLKEDPAPKIEEATALLSQAKDGAKLLKQTKAAVQNFCKKKQARVNARVALQRCEEARDDPKCSAKAVAKLDRADTEADGAATEAWKQVMAINDGLKRAGPKIQSAHFRLIFALREQCEPALPLPADAAQ